MKEADSREPQPPGDCRGVGPFFFRRLASSYWGFALKKLAVVLITGLFASSPALAGWERTSDGAIGFTGVIDRNSYEEYLALAEDGYSELTVNSGGGEPAIALRIAEDIASRDVTVRVKGSCMSACANYLAMAGRRLVVEEGALLAWHGTLPDVDDGRARMVAENLPAPLVETYVEWLTDFKIRERAFFAKVGVDYRLLQDSADIIREDKLVPEAGYSFDEVTGAYSITRSAAMWIPTPDVLEDYGINTDGFRWRYTDSDVAQWARKHGFRTPYATRGRRRAGPPGN